MIDDAIVEEPPISVKEGGIIKKGYNAEIDKLKNAGANGKAVRFNESLVRSTKRAASGVKGIRVAEGQRAIGMCIVNSEEDEIIILNVDYDHNDYFKNEDDYRQSFIDFSKLAKRKVFVI